mgnify:CR=1 FL=1
MSQPGNIRVHLPVTSTVLIEKGQDTFADRFVLVLISNFGRAFPPFSAQLTDHAQLALR